MLRNCSCFGRQRRGSSFEDSSSCRSSEIERGSESLTGGGGGGAGGALTRMFASRGWCRHWCKAGRSMSMTKVERTMKAAILIQRWYRRYLARMEIRRRYTWTIFQSIEYAGEQDQVRLYNFFNALLKHIPETANKATESSSASRASSIDRLDSKFSDESDEGANTDGIVDPERTYRGPHLTFPLQKKDIDTLIDFFRKKKYNRLHAKYVAGILRESATRLKRMPNLNQASTAISKQVTICGDLHGKLDDLLVVFHKNDLPSPENPYVFNGDFVDRGKKSLEVLLLLLSCFMVFPGGVFLNRGNHEDSVMNARYGFIREVHQKYKHNAERLLKLIDEVYRWLPLGTIVNNRVLVVHGGISDATDLDMIRSLDRSKYVSLLRPPLLDTPAGADAIDKVEWKQVFDILWSDPQHNEGCQPNGLRGAGTYFGPDVTQAFLQKHKLEFLVRSHECKQNGYEKVHKDKVTTIFSASNYYEIGSNKGAYLKLNPQLDSQFVQFTSAASKSRKLTFRQRVGLVESSALRELGARLRECGNELEREFAARDPAGTGVLTLTKWCESMEAATKLGLPWRLLREKLAPPDADQPTTDVTYRRTLDMLEDDLIKIAHAGTTSVADSLYRNKSSLEVIFRILDKDNSGFISLDEFAEACELLKKHLPEHDTKEQLLEMCKMMDINKDGLVDLNEFLETFRLCEQTGKGAYGKPDLKTLLTATGAGNSTAGVVSGAAQAARRIQGELAHKASTDDDDEEAESLLQRRGAERSTTMTMNGGGDGGTVETLVTSAGRPVVGTHV